jgi:hypothetical protein
MMDPKVVELITVAANVALALSLVVGLVFGIAQVRAAARDRRERFTLEALHSYQTREFAELMRYINFGKLPGSYKELVALPAEEQILFMEFAQQMESLGILLGERLINIDLVDKTLGSFVTTSWDKCKPALLDARQKVADPFLAEYFQWLAEQIDDRMKKNPRKPFFESHPTSGTRK